MATKTLENLFHDQLKDIYYAEKRILKALPKMAKSANSEKLAAGFRKHLEETKGQIERLERVFKVFGKKPQAKKCPAIDGILEEGDEVMKEYKDSSALDAGLIASAQAVEHYEMSRYRTLICWSELLGLQDAVKLLNQTLLQETKTDETLNKMAESQTSEDVFQEAA